jgi:hypothetical protein
MLWSRAETVVKVVDEILTAPPSIRVRSDAPVTASQASRHRKPQPGLRTTAGDVASPFREPPAAAPPANTERR